MNGIGYTLVFILFIWDKIYYIVRKIKYDYSEENYFSTFGYDSCPVHKTYTCDCENMKYHHLLVEKYLKYYRISTQIISFDDGKLRYHKNDKVTQLKFII